MNIEDVEPELAKKLVDPLRDALRRLSYFPPEPYQIRVLLLDESGRKKRSNAAARSWSPDSGRIEIRFEPASQGQEQLRSQTPGRTEKLLPGEPDRLTAEPADSTPYLHPAEADLLRALNRAESRPGWSFVPLKKFRDELLPQEHLASMRTEVEQHSALRSVIEKRFVLLGKVPNPKSPQFPVTAIRLNRLMPEVRAALGQKGNADLDFHPVEIQGEPLSVTILRERR
jgi:hypothetical protein